MEELPIPACQMQAIGVASTDTLPDAAFSASTESTNFEASRGRLNALKGWSPSSNHRPYDHLQIDLQYEFLICAVATQGRSTSADWTTKYKLQLSLDGSTFVTYKENNVDKTFSGNSGRHDIVKHNLRDVRARFIRFQPVKFFRNKALRVEVYGVLISRVPSQAPSELTLSAASSASIAASWQLPPAYSRHGIIVGFKLFYKKKGLRSIRVETINGGTTFSVEINGLDKYTEYEFQVLAFTSHGDGPKSSVVVERTLKDESLKYTKETIKGDAKPSVAPNDVSFIRLNQTTFNISWSPLTRKESYSKVISYEVKISLVLSGSRQKRSPANSKTVNTTKAFAILYDIQPCYNVYVRAYTKAGPGPYGQPLPLELIPGAPNNLRATDSQSTEMTLEWEIPQPAMGEEWKVEYSGKKSYNNSFSHEGSKDVQGTTKYTLDNLVPGTKYDLRVYGISKCGNNGFPSSFEVETKIGEPLAPVVLSLTTRKVAELQAEIDLWPAEQRNGPISAYQIIILKVSDCVQELPKDFHLKLKDLNDENLNFHPFYIAAEIENDPVHEKSWKFTVGDGKSYGTFINKELRKGGNYFAYQRAITRFNGQILEGYARKVASISVTPESLKYTKETIKGDTSESQVFRAAVIALCCIVFFLLIVIGALIWRLRRTELNKKATTVNSGIPAPSGGHQVSEPGVYMELHPRPSEGKSREPPEYQSLQDTQVTSNYYNVGFKRERSGKKDGGIYENSHS